MSEPDYREGVAKHLLISTCAIERPSQEEVQELGDKFSFMLSLLERGSRAYTAAEVERAKIEWQNAKARASLRGFAEVIWEESVGRKFEVNWHHEILFEEVERALTKPLGRFIANIPPRYGKTEISAKVAVPWIFGINPAVKVMMTAADERVSTKTGVAVLKFMRSPKYKTIFPDTVLTNAAPSAKNFSTTMSGEYASFGQGNNPRGFGGDIVFVDDPHPALPPDRKDTEAGYLQVWDWYDELCTREESDAAHIVLHTRFHEKDLTGMIIASENKRVEEMGENAFDDVPEWRQIVLPEVLEGTVHAHRGEVLWETKFSPRACREKKIKRGPKIYAAQYMQTPLPGGGDARILPKDWKSWEGELPRADYIIQSYDPAYTTNKESDYTGYIEIGLFKKVGDNRKTDDDDKPSTTHFYDVIVLEAAQWKIETPALKQKMMERWEKSKPNKILVEGRAGHPIVQELRKTISVLQIVTPTGLGFKGGTNNKEDRLESVVEFWRNDKVWVPKDAKWVSPLMQQFASFPGGTHDDMVDAMSQALRWVRDAGIMLLRHDNVVTKKWNSIPEPKLMRWL